ncbi:hypothetical protein LIER_06812 [Lithospermum erythrorhizon]|uniref:Aminotransferase-like plant mobile domain-containing protein n=1 Tax=Lithospermum erythrorhizon TaxID=34254 RepID=A0AAV3P9N2_LITER
MASCMVVGKTVSLAIPVLASIYRRLHHITTAYYPTNYGSCFWVHCFIGWIGTYLHVSSPVKKYAPGPHMVRFGGVDRRLSFSLSEAYQFLDERVPYLATIRPSRPTPQVRAEHNVSEYIEVSCCKSYSAWLDSVFSTESIRSAPLEPGKGKSTPLLPSSMISSLSKPFKKCSLPEDDSVDRDPKYSKRGTTRRPGPIVVSSSDVPAAITKDVKTATLAETVFSSDDEARTEIMDSDESSDCMVAEVADSGDEAQEIMDSTRPLDCMIMETAVTGSPENGAQTEVVDVEEPSDCVIAKAVVVEGLAASLFTGIQRIESILRDNLRVSWLELCSFVEAKSHGDLLAEEGGIMASIEALTKDTQCSVVLSEVRDRLTAIQTASVESASKPQHEAEAIGSVRIILQQFEEKTACLRQELADLDTHVEDLRR